MKATLVVFALLITSAACQTGKKESSPPDQIQQAFKKLHPNATVLKWNDESPVWEAKYQDGKEKGAVSFDASGAITETELVITQSELPNPPSIPDHIASHYPNEKIQGCEKITSADGTVSYEVQITGKELVFDAEGKFVEEELD